MALVVSSFCGEEKARKSLRKPWMLKDYLGDDLSSCSSNGFRSFPRRQCCGAAVRSIIDKNVVVAKPPKRMIVRNRVVSSTLHRASMAVIKAVKMLPFNSQSNNKSAHGNRILPRSFSKKLFWRSFFWKKDRSNNNNNVVVQNKEDDHDHDEIERWISSGVVGKEMYQPLDLSNDTTVTTTSVSNSNSHGKSDSSWSDLTFTSGSSLTCSSENDTVEGREKLVEEVVSRRVGVIAAHDNGSVEPAVVKDNMWCNEDVEKEQSSPISVLDFPYNDEGSASPFTLRELRIKGTKERLMKKLGRFECLAGLEPINLESLISTREIEEDRSPRHSILPCSTPSYILSSESEEEDDDEEEENDGDEEEEESCENEVERQARYLLNMTKAGLPSINAYNFELENVLLDYFRENVIQKSNHTLLKVAEDWITGNYDKLILGWEVKDKREVYMKDMEEGGWWPNDTKIEREEVATKLGNEVMSHMIEELMMEVWSLSTSTV